MSCNSIVTYLVFTNIGSWVRVSQRLRLQLRRTWSFQSCKNGSRGGAFGEKSEIHDRTHDGESSNNEKHAKPPEDWTEELSQKG